MLTSLLEGDITSSSIILVYSLWLSRQYLKEAKYVCMTAHCFKFKCHPIVINLTGLEGSANAFFFYPPQI